MQHEDNGPSIPYQEGIRVDDHLEIKRQPKDVYAIWRDLPRLPQIMSHLKSVTFTGANRSHWVADGPAGRTVEWDAEVINDIPGELIAWRSLPGSQVATAGSVHLTPTAEGTALKVELQYDPPGGSVGWGIAKLLGNSFADDIRHDLRKFRDAVESKTHTES
jgi:uncharacterized membrane protein